MLEHVADSYEKLAWEQLGLNLQVKLFNTLQYHPTAAERVRKMSKDQINSDFNDPNFTHCAYFTNHQLERLSDWLEREALENQRGSDNLLLALNMVDDARAELDRRRRLADTSR